MSRPPLRASRALAALAAVALLVTGCATTPTGRVVLLPSSDGAPAAVVVNPAGEAVVLDKPYAAATVARGDIAPYTATPDEVKQRFGAALAAQPPVPQRFVLYFVENSDELVPASRVSFEDAFAAIARYPVADIVVVGHTDRSGNDAVNDALALRRAESVRAALVRRGVPADSVVAIGRGKREPLVPTPDGVPEPRNRRVEIVVR
jgi:OOP family OmpA-OmpF porin